MTAVEAIVMAEHLLKLNDKYEVAKMLLQLEHKAELRGTSNMADDIIESLSSKAAA